MKKNHYKVITHELAMNVIAELKCGMTMKYSALKFGVSIGTIQNIKRHYTTPYQRMKLKLDNKHNHKLTDRDIECIRIDLSLGVIQNVIAKRYKVSRQCISQIKHEQTHKFRG